MSREESMYSHTSAVMFRGYKPLASTGTDEYFYHRGTIYVLQEKYMQPIVTVRNKNWKDINRVLIRLFRNEPKYAVMIQKNLMLLVESKKILLIDLYSRTCQVLTETRNHFSDPLNILPTDCKWLAIWGDYGVNTKYEAVNIYGLNRRMEIETIYTFQPGQIRHVHNIIPKLDGGYYIFTGDQEKEAGIYQADESFHNVSPVAIGEQKYRSVIGFDTPDGLVYATDAVNEKNYIYLRNSAGDEEKLFALNGSCIYGIRNHNGYLFSTTVEPDENNKGFFSWFSSRRGRGILSDEVYLIYLDWDLQGSTIGKYKKDRWPMKLMQYGSIQFMRGNSENDWIYPVGVKTYDGRAIRLKY